LRCISGTSLGLGAANKRTVRGPAVGSGKSGRIGMSKLGEQPFNFFCEANNIHFV
jgi:hypothetical protein